MFEKGQCWLCRGRLDCDGHSLRQPFVEIYLIKYLIAFQPTIRLRQARPHMTAPFASVNSGFDIVPHGHRGSGDGANRLDDVVCVDKWCVGRY